MNPTESLAVWEPPQSLPHRFTIGGAVSSMASEVASLSFCTKSRSHCSAERVSLAMCGAFGNTIKCLRGITGKWFGHPPPTPLQQP